MTFLQMSFSGAILILAVALIRKLLIGRLPKQTFLFLWGIALLRLLLPFSIPADFSVYSLAGQSSLIQEEMYLTAADDLFQEEETELVLKEQPVRITAEPEGNKISLVKIIWCMGMVFGAVFFGIIWQRCRWDLKTSIPVENPYVKSWLKAHPLKRTIEVRQSDRIFAPMTCGIIHPVILMPQNMDWKKEEQLHYILLHEYIHIRHFDMV